MRHLRLALRALPVLLSSLWTGLALAAPPDHVPGQIIVKLRAAKAGAALPSLRDVADRRIGVMRPRLTRVDARASVLELDGASKQATLNAISALRDDPAVEWAEPNYIRHIDASMPNDPVARQQWALPKAHVLEAWDRTLGATTTIVAVIDSGIMEHPDLMGRLLPGYDFISDVTNAADGNGRDADPTDTGSEQPTSTGFHGTHVAGIIAARSGNGSGIAGIDWNCKVLPVRALGIDRGTGTDLDITDAMRWAAGLSVAGAPMNPNPARVLNLSFGGAGGSQLMNTTIAELRQRGVIIIASAGNDNVDAGSYTPAGVPGVITVGATRYDGVRAPYSNYGATIELMAPGGDLTADQDGDGNPDGIVSLTFSRTQNAYGYVYYQGTSQAAPQVTGVVSLMIAIDPALTPARAEQLLMETANVASKCSAGCGAGLIDAGAVLTRMIGAPAPSPMPQPSPDPVNPDPAPEPDPADPTAPTPTVGPSAGGEYYGGCNAGAPGRGNLDGSGVTPLVLLLLAAFLARALRRQG